MQAMAASFDAPAERMTNIMPLLYQSGYIAIKDYDKLTQLYTLDIPNREIRVGLMQSLNFEPEKHTLGDWLIEEPAN